MRDQHYLHSPNPKAETIFPYLVMDTNGGKSIPKTPSFHIMHWHEDLQFIYVLSGTIYVRTLYQLEKIRSGEAVFINRNVVHQIQSDDLCHYVTIRFPEQLVSFYQGSPAKRYVTAYSTNPDLSVYLFRENVDWHANVIHLLCDLIALENRKVSAYEYEVLVLLSRLWLELVHHIEAPIEHIQKDYVKRMQLFLQYIDEHYSENFSLNDLAKSANVSKSECLRCFRLSLQTTPYNYLKEYRLQQAALLLVETNQSISYVAVQSGFRQSSHFGKCFKERTGYTPKDFRKRNRNQ